MPVFQCQIRLRLSGAHHNDLQWIIDAVWPRARANMANNREDSTIQTGGDFYHLDHIRCSNISMGLKKIPIYIYFYSRGHHPLR